MVIPYIKTRQPLFGRMLMRPKSRNLISGIQTDSKNLQRDIERSKPDETLKKVVLMDKLNLVRPCEFTFT